MFYDNNLGELYHQGATGSTGFRWYLQCTPDKLVKGVYNEDDPDVFNFYSIENLNILMMNENRIILESYNDLLHASEPFYYIRRWTMIRNE